MGLERDAQLQGALAPGVLRIQQANDNVGISTVGVDMT
jgi:hypothetical protein